jgi:hypothetical protein
MTYKLKSAVVMFSAAALFAPLSALAQPPRPQGARVETRQDRPRYLKARSDLREVQVILRNFGDRRVARNLQAAVGQLDLAIREVERAAVADGRNLDRNPPPDISADQRGRFRRALELTKSARENITQEEDNPSARVWRNRAFRNIDAAERYIRQAQVQMRMDREGTN